MTPLRMLVAVALLCAGCASTTSGSGRIAGSAARPSPPDFPLSVSVRPTSGVSAPRACSTPECSLVKSIDLGGGSAVALYGNTSANGGVGAAIVKLTQDGTPTYWRVFDGETPSEFVCNVAGSVRNCVLVDYVGAHSATAYPIVLIDRGLWIGRPVGTDTPDLHAADLDGDNRIDAYGRQNNYVPDYATGKVQWQTWQRSNDGTAFTSTGCGPLSAAGAPAPRVLLTGPCVA